MKKILARCLMLATLSMCLVGLTSSISARPQCQSGCFDWFVCETVLNPETGQCVTTRCNFSFGCVLQDTLEQIETGPGTIQLW
jgi:hypothetical protein